MTGFKSLKVAVGNWSLCRPIERMRWSRIDLSLVSWLTSTLKDPAVTFTVLPDSVSVAAPVMADVRPMASLCAGRNASFSRTRWPACEPRPIVQVPAKPLLSLAAAGAPRLRCRWPER